MGQLPVGVRCCQQPNLSLTKWRAFIFIFTLFIYTTFHASRKPISVVKSVLHPNCTEIALKENKTITPENATFCMWKPFDTNDYNALLGYLDLSFLLSYALGMFFLGQVAERIICGFFQSSGWPAVVTIMGNWFGKSNKSGNINSNGVPKLELSSNFDDDDV
ncbi:unnamed protein product [Rodentolepis nana]|uniref:Sialin n=1 Tax=Rodentolepis nana TaxID=102285 RepID=A0A0R3TAM9_RODNA|nr:unnamed protein product [Rodentolepis nana]